MLLLYAPRPNCERYWDADLGADGEEGDLIEAEAIARADCDCSPPVSLLVGDADGLD